MNESIHFFKSVWIRSICVTRRLPFSNLVRIKQPVAVGWRRNELVGQFPSLLHGGPMSSRQIPLLEPVSWEPGSPGEFPGQVSYRELGQSNVPITFCWCPPLPPGETFQMGSPPEECEFLAVASETLRVKMFWPT